MKGKYLVIHTACLFGVTTRILPTLTKVRKYVKNLDKRDYRIFRSNECGEIQSCNLRGQAQ